MSCCCPPAPHHLPTRSVSSASCSPSATSAPLRWCRQAAGSRWVQNKWPGVTDLTDESLGRLAERVGPSGPLNETQSERVCVCLSVCWFGGGPGGLSWMVCWDCAAIESLPPPRPPHSRLHTFSLVPTSARAPGTEPSPVK